VRLHITVTLPDQDLTRAHARTELDPESPGDTSDSPHPLSAEAQTVAAAATDSLVEPLRGLGGESTAAILDLRVRCTL
jgi:hypothetical protein